MAVVNNPKIGAALAIVLIAGMAYSVWDYRKWQAIDKGNFGQGSEEERLLSPAQELSRPVSLIDKIRLKPPLEWKLEENSYFQARIGGYPAVPVVRTEVARFTASDSAATIVVSAQTTNDEAADLIDKDAVGVTKDRQYITTEEGNFTILTWENENTVTQKAYTINSGQLWVIEATCARDAWTTWAKTFENVYRSVVWI